MTGFSTVDSKVLCIAANRLRFSRLAGATNALARVAAHSWKLCYHRLGAVQLGGSRAPPRDVMNAASPSHWHRAAERSIHPGDEPFLGSFHNGCGARVLIVKPMQMEEAVGNVEPHLVVGGGPETPGLAPRRLGADENLPVLKGDHVGRPRFLKKTAM